MLQAILLSHFSYPAHIIIFKNFSVSSEETTKHTKHKQQVSTPRNATLEPQSGQKMAKLITNHDPFHIHKVLGLLVLINYIYRFFLIFTIGTAFPAEEPVWKSLVSVALHGLLSWSSLLLPLPAKRNFNSPMIWPEFRLHSITFASRHIIATLLTLCNIWPQNLWGNALARAAFLASVIKAASVITDKLGCRLKRTTNAMPYPPTVSEEQQKMIKIFYTLSQFGASAACLLSDPTINFAPLLAIQMAPLMMTLVRKGKVSSTTYHRIYSVSLYLGYVMVFLRMICAGRDLGMNCCFVLGFPSDMLRKYMSAMKVWMVVVTLGCILYPLVLHELVQNYVSEGFAFRYLCFAFAAVMIPKFWIIVPLFSRGWAVSITVGNFFPGETKKSLD